MSHRNRRPQAYKGKSFGPEDSYRESALPKVRTRKAPRKQSTRRAAVAAAIREDAQR
jgi:hypothetical protein